MRKTNKGKTAWTKLIKMSIRVAYEKAVCCRLREANPVPYRRVLFADGSRPQQNCCHDNVERWVRENLGTSAVSGWVDYMPAVNGRRLTAHSVVRGTDGKLFDITPLADERVRPALRFVPHVGDEQLFSQMKQLEIECRC
jgi:hypothetical protein